MCGFAGLLLMGGASGLDLDQTVARMTETLVHRGPDDAGRWSDPATGIALGFRRLAIVDLSAHGHQPMRSASGRFMLVFNGEVYNHLALRRELEEAGFRFRGHSDTETILAAFEHWGVRAAVGRFVGMFVMALWDVEERKLSLVRDRLGIKPLYFGRKGGTFLFGSELKALMAVPGFDRAIDEEAISAYLRYRYVPAPRSIFRDVKKLLPGTILEIREGDAGNGREEPFWSIADVIASGIANPVAGSDDEIDAEVERLLEDSIRLRLQADVPLGALLSGGIDSSLVVALAQRVSPFALKTFCIGFDDAAHNEAPHAAAVARHLGTTHTELTVTGEDALQLVPRLPVMFDEPLANASQIPTYMVCELARRNVTVALSGDGGDEVMAGYHRYLDGERLISRMSHVPAPLRRLAAAGIGSVSSSGWDRTYRAVGPLLPGGARHRLAGQKVSKIGNLLRGASEAEMYRSLLSAWQEPRHFLHGGAPDASPVDHALDRFAGLPLIERMMATDQVTYLPDDLLAKVDRASMAVGLEVRVPLLDHRLIEYAWRLPRDQKIRDGHGKHVLRRILFRHVPRELVERPKTGFTVPVAAWLNGPLREWASDLLSGDPGDLLNREAVLGAWGSFRKGEHHLADGLWTILQLIAWRREWNA